MTLDLATKIAAVKKPKPTNFEAWLETIDAEDRQALDNARHVGSPGTELEFAL